MKEQRQESPSTDRVLDEVVDAPAIGSESGIPNPQSSRALTRLTVLATVILPITLLPYLAARRNTNLLRKQLEEYAVTVAKLQRDLKSTLLENALRRDEHARVRGLLTEMRQETRKLGAELKQDMQSSHVEGELRVIAQAKTDIMLRSDLLKILEQTRRTRTAQFAIQRELGISLADIAAFMHEQGLSEGRDNHGIERLRWLALSLQNPPPDIKEPDADPIVSRSHDDISSTTDKA